MRSEGHGLRRDERSSLLPLVSGERATSKDGAQVQRGQGVQDDDFVSSVGIDALVEREERRVRVESSVGRRVLFGDQRVLETSDEFFEVSFALSGSDG